VADRFNRPSAMSVRVAEVLGGMGQQLRDLPKLINSLLAAEIAELSGDGQLEDLLNETVAANVETWFSALRYDIPIELVEPPAAALEHARRMAQRGVSVNSLLRAYRLGHQQGLRFVIDEIRRSNLSPELKLDLYEHTTRVSFGYIDWVSEQLLDTYQAEHAVWEEDRRGARTQGVLDVLAGMEVDAGAMSETIRYPMDALHTAIVLWWDRPRDDRGMQSEATKSLVQRASRAVGANSMLYQSVDRLVAWAWLAVRDASSATQLRAFVESESDAPRVAIGSALSGIDGFRRSHRQAERARDVAIAAKGAARRFISASDPGVALGSLFVDDIEAMRTFVHDTLGPLAYDSAPDLRLRETAEIFLRSGASFKTAGIEMHLHGNTVKYRVKRAALRRGRPLTDGRLDVEIALQLCALFGSVVLRSDGQTD
jgi:DNA-binding PucR family transcriptional regulator